MKVSMRNTSRNADDKSIIYIFSLTYRRTQEGKTHKDLHPRRSMRCDPEQTGWTVSRAAGGKEEWPCCLFQLHHPGDMVPSRACFRRQPCGGRRQRTSGSQRRRTPARNVPAPPRTQGRTNNTSASPRRNHSHDRPKSKVDSTRRPDSPSSHKSQRLSSRPSSQSPPQIPNANLARRRHEEGGERHQVPKN